MKHQFKVLKLLESAFKSGRSKETWKSFIEFNPDLESLEEEINEFAIGFMEYSHKPEVLNESERDPSEVLSAYKLSLMKSDEDL